MRPLSPTILTLAKKFGNAQHYIHLLVLAVALALALPAVITAIRFDFDWAKFHLDWKTYVGLVMAALQWTLRRLSRLYLRSVESAAISPLSPTPIALPVSFRYELADNPDRLEELSAYIERHHPADYVSQLRQQTRREMYARWFESVGPFAMLVKHAASGRTDVVAACVVLPITAETFALYRNAQGTPDAWTASNLRQTADQEIFFVPVLHCQKRLGSMAPALLAELFASFAGERVRTDRPVFVSPVRTNAGRANVQRLGFEMFRHSKTGFEVWELDGRRGREVSSAATQTLRALIARRPRSAAPPLAAGTSAHFSTAQSSADLLTE